MGMTTEDMERNLIRQAQTIGRLRNLLHDADEAINPPDRGGLSMEKWNERLKAITAKIRTELA